jgi:putative PIN family toxin of toxin-antitoxin system
VRVCLDTNVLVAAFATRGLCADVLRVCLTEHDVVIGDVHLTELRRVLKTKFKLPDDKIGAVEAVFSSFEIVPKPTSAPAFSIRDAADRWILATAISGHADVLVTGDNDLLTVASESPIPIITPRAFWQLLVQ